MTYTATYSADDDKLRLTASSRLEPELYQRVKAAGFRWAPKQEVFYAVWNPAAEDLCLELVGEISDEDSSLVERAEVRADRFEGYSENRTKDAERAHAAVHAIADGIPLGQPILVGHHSERHARRDAAKIESELRRAVKMWDTACYWQSRAEGALRHARYLESPDVRSRRIKGLESDVRVYRSKFTPIGKQVIMQRKWSAPKDAAEVPHVWCAPRGGRGGSWVAAEDLPGIERHYSRWISHAENRLVYERAMLAEAGASDLLKPKPRSAAASLPLCNYRAPEGLDIENKWRRGEIIHYPQVEMTAAEYAAINVDYKSTRVVGNSHRVRTALQRGELVSVFITDSKVHATPGAVTPAPVSEPKRWPVMTPAPEPTEKEKQFDTLRNALKQGVQVVSAPQLFPTPAALADRMVRLADLQPGLDILEPSAGTGAIVDAVRRVPNHGCVITAVEIVPKLAERLQNLDCLGRDHVHCADFLECNGNLGTFDRILLNPPFVGGADIQHITHAVKFLKPGGKLIAICAGGPRQAEKLRPLCDTWEPLPAGTFDESGTGVNTVLLTISKACCEQAQAQAHGYVKALNDNKCADCGTQASLFPEGGDQ